MGVWLMDNDEAVDLKKEAEELGMLIDVHTLIEQSSVGPNRAQRRARAKQDRSLKKGNPRV